MQKNLKQWDTMKMALLRMQFVKIFVTADCQAKLGRTAAEPLLTLHHLTGPTIFSESDQNLLSNHF